MDKMQEEAMRRVREMQSGNMPQRAQSGNHRQSENQPKAEPSIATQTKPEPQPQPSDPLTGLFKDKEKLLILLLIMLLSQESSNTELVLALLYIII